LSAEINGPITTERMVQKMSFTMSNDASDVIAKAIPTDVSVIKFDSKMIA